MKAAREVVDRADWAGREPTHAEEAEGFRHLEKAKAVKAQLAEARH